MLFKLVVEIYINIKIKKSIQQDISKPFAYLLL